jgi:diacylglycerol kinase (ATP)
MHFSGVFYSAAGHTIMKITLIHNPTAGAAGQPGARQLCGLIRACGHEVHYHSSKARNWASALAEPADIIAVAGGDGTVGRVLRAMVGRKAPVAILPMGTANNFSRSLGIAGTPIEQHIASWANARSVKVDAASVSGPWDDTYCVEGLGVGLFAWVMPKAERDRALSKMENPRRAVSYAIKLVKKRLRNHPARRVNATLDGKDISGDYLLFEVLNTQFIGPNLYLSPHGHAGDGLLDVVMVTEKEREHFYECLSKWQKCKLALPDLPTERGRKVALQHGDYDLHVDDRIYTRHDAGHATAGSVISIELKKSALRVVVPF